MNIPNNIEMIDVRGCARTWTCVRAPPRHSPPPSPSDQSAGRVAARASRPCSGGGGSRVYTLWAELRGAVVKRPADGPFGEPSSEKLRNTASLRGRAVKAYLSPFWGVLKRKESRSARLPHERSEKCQWKCSIRTRCHHRSSAEPNYCISGEFPPF